MNAIDLMTKVQNNEQIVPQFAPNGYTLMNKNNDKKIDIDDYNLSWLTDEKTYPKSRALYKATNGNEYDSYDGWFVEPKKLSEAQKSQNMTMLYNALEALKTRQFNEKMYDQRYQKIIQDIKKAGLNPYAINFFSPGGVQSGSAASIMSNYQASNSQVRSKSQNKNENHNFGDTNSAGIIGALQMLGMVIGAIVKTIAMGH